MGTITRIRGIYDSLANFATKLGTSADPVMQAQWTINQLTKQDVENAYRSDWIARKVISAPAQDSTREWRAWQTTAPNIEKIENLEKQHDLRRKMRDAIIKGRLYGGGALVMGVDVGQSDEELDLEQVTEGSLKFIHVMHCWELTSGPLNFDVTSKWYGQPQYYIVNIPEQTQLSASAASGGTVVQMKRSNAGMMQIHPSRVVRMLGSEFPDWRNVPAGNQWSDSVLQGIDDTLRQTGLVVGGISSMVSDAKMDVISIPKLGELLADKDSAAKLVERFTLANQIKGINSTLILDENEKWQRITTQMGSMPELIRMYLLLASGASDIPASRLIGQAPRGLQGATSGGAMEDTRSYYDRISSEQETDLSPALTPLDEVVVRSSLGTDDPSIYYEWNPLWQMSDAEKADIALKKSQATQVYVGSGLFNEDLLREAISNQLSEDGTYPGWQDAVDEYSLEPPQPTTPDPATMAKLLAGQSQKLGPDGKPLPPEQLKIAPPPVTKDSVPRGRRKKT